MSKESKQKERAEFNANNQVDKTGYDYSFKNTRGLYNDELLPKVEELASKGLTNADIARALCIGNKTFYEWKIRFPQFAHALSKYRGVADIMIENALYMNALGYNYNEQMVTPKGSVVDVKKYKPGNASAQIFYLKNRMQHRYKDKVETQITLAQDISNIQFLIKRREE